MACLRNDESTSVTFQPIGSPMNLNKPLASLTASERQEVARNLAEAKPYGSPRRVWSEDGHVFVEGYDGDIISMTPEIAITMGKFLSSAGTDSLINRVMGDNTPATTQDQP